MQTITHAVDGKSTFFILQHIIRYTSDLGYTVEISFHGIFPIGQDGSMVCVCIPLQDNEYGVVSVVNRNLYCMLCRRACKHVLHVEQLMESENCPESLEILSISLRSSPKKSYKATSPAGISWEKNTFLAPFNSAKYFA